MNQTKIAVLLPCFNEAIAIGKVVRDFRRVLPSADIYVFDNNSTDRTREVAREAGAIVRVEPRQGKGNVIRRMFRDVKADVYVMADGDDTYCADVAPEMVTLLQVENLDMVVATRQGGGDAAYRPGHVLGNRLFNRLLTILFNSHFTDIFSGYRAFSSRFVRTFPSMSQSFDTETEMTIHALEIDLPVKEIPAPYGARPEGSQSKLRTYRHGFTILWRIFILLKEERPILFFGAFAAFLAVLSLVLFYPIFVTYYETGLVPRFPTAILSATLMLLAFFSLSSGLILDGVSRGRKELKRLFYLNLGTSDG